MNIKNKLSNSEKINKSSLTKKFFKKIKNKGISNIELISNENKLLKLKYNDGKVTLFSRDIETIKGDKISIIDLKKGNDILYVKNRDKSTGLEEGKVYYNMKELSNGKIKEVYDYNNGNNSLVIVQENAFLNLEGLGYYDYSDNFESILNSANVGYNKGEKILSFDKNGLELLTNLLRKDLIEYLELYYHSDEEILKMSKINKGLNEKLLNEKLLNILEKDEDGNVLIKTKDIVFINGEKINEGEKLCGFGKRNEFYSKGNNVFYNKNINGKDNVFCNERCILNNISIDEDIYNLNMNNKENLIIPLGVCNINENIDGAEYEYGYQYNIIDMNNGKIKESFNLKNSMDSFKEDGNGNFIFKDSSGNTYINNSNNKIGNFKNISVGDCGSIGGNFTIDNHQFSTYNNELIFCSTNDNYQNSAYYFEKGNNLLDIYKNGKLHIKLDLMLDSESINKARSKYSLVDAKNKKYYITGEDNSGEFYIWLNYEKYQKIEGINSLNEIESLELDDNENIKIIMDKTFKKDLDIEL